MEGMIVRMELRNEMVMIPSRWGRCWREGEGELVGGRLEDSMP